MKDLLLLDIKKFAETHWVSGRTLILGCSGGPDSMALLHLLTRCKRFRAFDLHVAHIDHGWREESHSESVELKALVESLGHFFHLKTLNKGDFQPGNWENQGREYRLKFFLELYQSLDSQGLVLGHHADDWSEVVLKRVFEGASLSCLGGLSKVSEFEQMQIYRPLLSFPKQKMVKWLSDQDLHFFVDPTNENPQFLRSRMRTEMVPFLTESFGKEIGSNLCRLGEEAQELRSYFNALNRPLFDAIDQHFLDLTPYLPLPKLQLKYFLKEWIQRERIFLSHKSLENAAESILQSTSSAKYHSGSGGFEIKNRTVLLFKS